MKIISCKKYLRKSEFRVSIHPDVISPRGDTHVVYVSAKRGHKAKVNVITHAKTFFGKPTVEMHLNPNRVKSKKIKDKKPSRFSVPVWHSDTTIKEKPKGYWKLHKNDKITIKKFNKKYAKK